MDDSVNNLLGTVLVLGVASKILDNNRQPPPPARRVYVRHTSAAVERHRAARKKYLKY